MPKEIDGIYFKEVYCKNDDCRAFLGYERVKRGALAFHCRRCKQITVLKVNYSQIEQKLDKMIEMKEGGEIENGGHNKG